MSLTIGIQPDEVVHRNGERQSYSRRWIELARDMDVDAISVDAFSPTFMQTVATCDAFMWRYDPTAHPRLFAGRLLYAVEQGLGIPVFPSLSTRWHFEDKIGQAYFLAAADIPMPATTVFWTREQATEFCATATYPFVLKLAIGYQGNNVRLVRARSEALYYVDQLFGHGVPSLGYRPASRARLALRRVRAAVELVQGRYPFAPTMDVDPQFGYFLAQEFLPGNAFDVRITVIGNRSFAFRRFNRPGDFRASGSGRVDWNPEAVAEDAIRLAYRVAHCLRAQTVAIDVLRRNGEPVVGELSLAYASWAVRDCPGHWVLDGDPASGTLHWVAGSIEPADAIFADFVDGIHHSTVAGMR